MCKKSYLVLTFVIALGCMANEQQVKTPVLKQEKKTNKEVVIGEPLKTRCGELRKLKMRCIDKTLKQANLGSWMLALRDNRQKLIVLDAMCWNIAFRQLDEALVVEESNYLTLANTEYLKVKDKQTWGQKKYKAECAETHKNFDPCIRQMITFETEDFTACLEALKND